MDGAEATKPQKDRDVVPAVSRCLSDGTLIELIYRPEERTTAFAVWSRGRWSIRGDVEADGLRLVPFSPRNNLIKNEAVVLPSQPSEYGSEEALIRDIRSFIHRYADLSASFEQVATYYVILTWLYDAFNEVPYLRFRGDFGTGKTRSLLVIGSLCYKAFFASGASTISPIFHTLDAFQGTLIFDEADFRFSDERSEIVKILNNGNVRGMPVLRTIMNRQREFNPQAFHVFGPKIVATRGAYEDRGLESRFITEEMSPRRLRSDIPINLPSGFQEEARGIRNKLLLYRFDRRAGTVLNEALIDPRLEPRLNQILVPLLSVIRGAGLADELRSVALNAQANLVSERRLSVEADVLEIIVERDATTRTTLPVAEVAAGLSERFGTEYVRPITNRWVGNIVRKRLGLQTHKSHGIYVIAVERAKIEALRARFGMDNGPELDVNHSGISDEPPIEKSGEVGSSGTL
jgi:hypothetical protein